MAGIKTLDSFLETYSAPAWLDEKPQNFASALKEWQQIQGNYYKNDKAKMELEDKEEKREKDKEREQKMLELGLTLDADDIQGSIRKVIDFSKGEGDINSAMSGIGRLYQLQERDKKKAETDLRRAMGISKKEQAKLEKAAKEKKATGYFQQGISVHGFSPEAIDYGVSQSVQDGDLGSVTTLAALKKSLFGTGKKEETNNNQTTQGLMNNASQSNQQPNTAGYKEGARRTNRNTGIVQELRNGEWITIGKVK